MALTKYEQETTALMNRDDDFAQVFTGNARHIRQILDDDRFEVIERNYEQDTDEKTGLSVATDRLESVTARISLEHFDVLGGLKRRKKPLTDAERKAMGERLAAARAARAAA